MADVKMTAGATPSKRLVIKEFLKEKMQRLDDNHTTLIIDKLKMEKDLAHLQNQVTMHEGAVLFLKQILREWDTYEADTIKLRQAEEIARSTQDNTDITKELPKTRKRKNNGEHDGTKRTSP